MPSARGWTRCLASLLQHHRCDCYPSCTEGPGTDANKPACTYSIRMAASPVSPVRLLAKKDNKKVYEQPKNNNKNETRNTKRTKQTQKQIKNQKHKRKRNDNNEPRKRKNEQTTKTHTHTKETNKKKHPSHKKTFVSLFCDNLKTNYHHDYRHCHYHEHHCDH